MQTTKLIYSDGHSEEIEGRWKATIVDISYPDYDEKNCDKEYMESHPEDDDFWIDFFIFDERCWIPMICFYGLVRPPYHIGKLIGVFCDEDEE